MRCPYCQSHVTETSDECPTCRLEYSRVRQLLGPVPIIRPGLSDDSRILDPRQRSRLNRKLRRIQERLPQVRIQLVCRSFPEDHPFHLYLFWVFNYGGFCPVSAKGGQNRHVLILLDATSHRSGAMVGYGLEPFIRQEDLDAVLKLGDDQWRHRKWFEGFECVLNGLHSLLEKALTEVVAAFDLTEPPSRRSNRF